MQQDVMELIQLFGLPYVVAPFEAEAQCAVLEQLGLVDGVVTEDSDTFLFGAKNVYRNIFADQKFVEVSAIFLFPTPICHLCGNVQHFYARL